MKLFFSLTITMMLSIIVMQVGAQNFEIYGKVLDKNTKEPIPFANIAIKDIYKGTASNILGEFSFKVDSLPLDLIITHLSYETEEITVLQSKELIIELEPGKLLMDEIVIQGPGNASYAYDLVRRAYFQILNKGRKEKYGKAFYRQISKNGDEYSELYEVFYDTKYSSNGVEDWAIQEGRYALKLSTIDSFIYNKNFTQMVRLLTVVQPKTDDLIMPVSELVQEQYDLTTSKILSVNDNKVALIKFTKKEDVTQPALEGEIYIDTETYQVLKISGQIADDNLNFISLTGNRSSWKDYVVKLEVAFKELDDDFLALDYMQLQQNFDYYIENEFANKVETKSFFTYYEYYEPPKRKKLGGRLMRFRNRDSDVLDAIGYNQLFWDENIIVKRTPVEAEVIEAFEKERAFGSIYLNNKNQLILEDYEIDNDPFIIEVKNQLKEYLLPRNGEKVYLHHDKPWYNAGENLWFKSYVVNMASNSPATRSHVLHLDILAPDGDKVYSQLFPIAEGIGNGKVLIPKNLDAGEYQLVAYTDWMMNFDPKLFFRKDILILNDVKQAETFAYNRSLRDTVNTFRFQAEGGYLVENMPAQIGFVGINRFGEAINVRGRLLNNIGRQVTMLKSDFHGFGSAFVLPKSDIAYETMIMSDEFEKEPFPVVKKAGYAIMVNNLKPNSIDISVRGTPHLEGKKFYLLVISNGVLFDRRIGMVTRGLYKTEIPKSNLPSGMAQILLVDDTGEVTNKRLVFLNQPESASIKYYLPKKEFKPNERVDMVFEVEDENGKALDFANLSVSIVDKDKISRNEESQNIRSYLTFDYLLDFRLDDSGTLFSDFERETLKKFDLVMLNQQSILPDIKTFKNPETSNNVQYPRESNSMIRGKANYQGSDQPLVNGYLSLIANPNPKKGIWYVRTDENGNFNLPNLSLEDSTKVFVLANDQNGDPKPVEVEIYTSFFDSNPVSRHVIESELEGDEKKYHQVVTDGSESDYINNRENGLLKSSNGENHDFISYPSFGKSDHTIIIDEKYEQYLNLAQVLQGKLPGITTNKETGEMQLKGKDKVPLIILDGVLLNKEVVMNTTSGSSLEQLPEILSQIPTNEVNSIEIIKDLEGIQIFGTSWDEGVIAIYTDNPERNIRNSESENQEIVWLPGLYKSDNFISPEYDKKDKTQLGSDSRVTLYWNPNITTNRKGRAKISFYNSDDARNMQICVEGMTADGVPIFDLYDFGRNYNKSRKNQ